MFKKILFPTDGSVPAEKAFKYVEDIALKYDAEVVLLHTYYVVDAFNGKPSNHYVYLEKVEKNMIAHGEEVLAKTKEALEAKGIKVTTFLEKGVVGATVIDKAETENCDVIVMGSRGLGNITSLLISSASNYVVHHAKRPVLLIH